MDDFDPAALHVGLAHGNGGRLMRGLITNLFRPHLGNPALDTEADAAPITLPPGEIVVTTDGFTVQPLQFPGGDIGALAIDGTVNDLAVSGARPLYVTLSMFIEEGLPMALLETIVTSLGTAADAAGVKVVAGDTKVVPRGQGGGLYLALTGIGVRPLGCTLGMAAIRSGDVVLLSGPVGDHGIAVMLAREAFGLRGDLKSDAASVLPLTQALLPLPGLRFMRDPTRGGLATVAHEIARGTHRRVNLDEGMIPISPATASVCAMLGYDPLYLASEGRVVAVIAPEQATTALAAWRALPQGGAAAIIGRIADPAGLDDPAVMLHTRIGGARILAELEADPLPRIC
ncbi:MAG: hydrogenase expression/formation protein HypE [Acidiphilium sp.]|nr:hydrogenase expression/formation protein HypE [Acidiphilium sp.]MDD4935103.1 hydrogenase expression/formation protein HypE [Acidiphilium sp.]